MTTETNPAGQTGRGAGVYLDNVGLIYESERSLPVEALRDLTFEVPAGGFVSVVGPSGCGKSTLLNLIAGLRMPDNGTVTTHGEVVAGPSSETGFVTQNDNLLPWRTAEKNIALSLEIQGVPSEERAGRIEEMIELVGLKGFAKHYPAELSGGMRKRVTLARTLIYKPQILLLDEPFGALDAQLRRVMQDELMTIWENIGCTVLFITHDLEEAIMLADRVVLLSARPGHVVLNEPVPFGRPRDVDHVRDTEEYKDFYHMYWSHLKDEIRLGEAVT